ncbi:MAG: type II toxin-antitoxin system RelE/ParE family toxin [Oscillospiraceae bacterium]|nr:type II toxin-antitoxin system RelE/ParE family toxin [Oscillospiraceae bacterium]
MRSYRVEYSERATKELKKLDRYTQRMIYAWIDKNLAGCQNPRAHGKALSANRKGQWRYRIGDWRLICAIEDERLVILALSVGHRREVYHTPS